MAKKNLPEHGCLRKSLNGRNMKTKIDSVLERKQIEYRTKRKQIDAPWRNIEFVYCFQHLLKRWNELNHTKDSVFAAGIPIVSQLVEILWRRQFSAFRFGTHQTDVPLKSILRSFGASVWFDRMLLLIRQMFKSTLYPRLIQNENCLRRLSDFTVMPLSEQASASTSNAIQLLQFYLTLIWVQLTWLPN